MLPSLLHTYGLDADAVVVPYGSGLINDTWKIKTADGEYILQRVNNTVFKSPRTIAHNITLIAGYLKQHHPDYYFTAPLPARNGEEMIFLKREGYFRLFPFVPGSHSKAVVETAEQAYEAAAQFGKFTRLLSGFDAGRLQITLPDFHNLDLRYKQFLDALQYGNKERIRESKDLIRQLTGHSDIVHQYNRLKHDLCFKRRVTHHDTKISNVLFDEMDKGICVIDLDTLMPGYFISDVGDMIRTCVSPVSEEEADLDKIMLREDFYTAIVQGYGSEMKKELTPAERDHFFYAGKFMTFMQALRFLTDYLNDDNYYSITYPLQNLTRAGNQMVLLERLTEKRGLE